MRIYKPCPLAIDLNDGHTLAAQSTHTNEAQAGPRSSRAEPSWLASSRKERRINKLNETKRKSVATVSSRNLILPMAKRASILDERRTKVEHCKFIAISS